MDGNFTGQNRENAVKDEDCMQSSVPNYETGNFIVTLNKSPSRYNSNVPPCISVSDCAIDNPRPLPSVAS
mgnify:CR=1 FL=1